MFNPMPKDPPYRNQKLRDAAKDVPHCMNRNCGAPNVGQIVLAHSNWQADGKGMGIKAHDIPCYLCDRCHKILDEHAFGTNEMRLAATYNSVLWCLREGILK